VLFNEPKLLKSRATYATSTTTPSFSALQRAEIAEMLLKSGGWLVRDGVSVLFNEPKLLKFRECAFQVSSSRVSVLFNEPKLLKSR